MTIEATAAALAQELGPLRLWRGRGHAAGGAHPRRRAGAGSDFWQFRMAEPNEPLERIDWRRSARSDDLQVRDRERQDPARLLLWLDGSPSMDFSSAADVQRKRDYAHAILLALALSAREGGEAVAWPGIASWRDMQAQLAHAHSAVLPQARLAPADSVVIAGDFLDADPQPWIASAVAAGACGCLLHIFDPAEAHFTLTGALRFEACEPGEQAFPVGEAGDIGAAYAAAWSAQVERLQRASDPPGWTYIAANTAAPQNVAAQVAHRWLAARC